MQDDRRDSWKEREIYIYIYIYGHPPWTTWSCFIWKKNTVKTHLSKSFFKKILLPFSGSSNLYFLISFLLASLLLLILFTETCIVSQLSFCSLYFFSTCSFKSLLSPSLKAQKDTKGSSWGEGEHIYLYINRSIPSQTSEWGCVVFPRTMEWLSQDGWWRKSLTCNIRPVLKVCLGKAMKDDRRDCEKTHKIQSLQKGRNGWMGETWRMREEILEKIYIYIYYIYMYVLNQSPPKRVNEVV